MTNPHDPSIATAPVTRPVGGSSDALATTMAFEAGLVAMQAGNATTALACFDEALSLDPDQPEAIYRRAVALLQLRRYHEALEAAQRVLAIDSEHLAAKQLVERLQDPAAGMLVNEPKFVMSPEPEWKLGDVIEGRWEVF